MTKIKIYRQNQYISGFECSGHTGYADEGSDIVCSAISSITLTAVLGLKNVVNQNLKISRDDNKGYLKVELKDLSEQNLIKCDVVLQTMLLGLKEVASAYKKYIKLEE